MSGFPSIFGIPGPLPSQITQNLTCDANTFVHCAVQQSPQKDPISPMPVAGPCPAVLCTGRMGGGSLRHEAEAR